MLFDSLLIVLLFDYHNDLITLRLVLVEGQQAHDIGIAELLLVQLWMLVRWERSTVLKQADTPSPSHNQS